MPIVKVKIEKKNFDGNTILGALLKLERIPFVAKYPKNLQK